jgi:hypothetical protein
MHRGIFNVPKTSEDSSRPSLVVAWSRKKNSSSLFYHHIAPACWLAWIHFLECPMLQLGFVIDVMDDATAPFRVRCFIIIYHKGHNPMVAGRRKFWWCHQLTSHVFCDEIYKKLLLLKTRKTSRVHDVMSHRREGAQEKSRIFWEHQQSINQTTSKSIDQ